MLNCYTLFAYFTLLKVVWSQQTTAMRTVEMSHVAGKFISFHSTCPTAKVVNIFAFVFPLVLSPSQQRQLQDLTSTVSLDDVVVEFSRDVTEFSRWRHLHRSRCAWPLGNVSWAGVWRRLFITRLLIACQSGRRPHCWRPWQTWHEFASVLYPRGALAALYGSVSQVRDLSIPLDEWSRFGT